MTGKTVVIVASIVLVIVTGALGGWMVRSGPNSFSDQKRWAVGGVLLLIALGTTILIARLPV